MTLTERTIDLREEVPPFPGIRLPLFTENTTVLFLTKNCGDITLTMCPGYWFANEEMGRDGKWAVVVRRYQWR